MKLFIQEETLNEIGNAIREKTETGDLIAPGDMPAMIRGIEGGGGGYEPTEADLTYTKADYLFSNDTNVWLLREYGNRIVINASSWSAGVSYCFMGCSMESLKGVKISATYYNGANMESLFYSCDKLKELPTIVQAAPSKVKSMFYDCANLREVTDEFFENFDWSIVDKQTSQYSVGAAQLYEHCYSLRKASMIPLAHNAHDFLTTTSYTPYYYTFYGCHSLDEILNIPVGCNHGSTDNRLNTTFRQCYRAKDITFAPYNGSVQWASQNLYLAEGVGHVDGWHNITSFNSGITSDKRVYDDASYQALKNDPDWYTEDVAYSRYNHDSAVNTINSLPTTTGSGCSVTFKGESGSKTDGGAINTLTDAEIAVAAAKGWTVAFE